MKKSTLSSFVLLFILFSLQAEARLFKKESRTILVSDIDDTIKVSHVLDMDSVIVNAFRTDTPFLGMPELYQGLIESNNVKEVFYLSTAPEDIMLRFHKRFLNFNDFPAGTLMLNKKLMDKEHKIRSLRSIIKKYHPARLILIGDNGERDTEVYAQIKGEYPNITIKAFIHLAYSLEGFENNKGKPLEKDQVGFATAMDLAVALHSDNLLTDSSYNNVFNFIAPVALSEGNYEQRGKPLMFPAWLDCRDNKKVQIQWQNDEDAETALAIEKKINKRCSREPYSN